MQKKSRKLFKPGQSGNPAGKCKGTLNKFTTLKADWLWVHGAIGGRERLKKWVEKSDRNLTLFYQMETKLFPQEVEHSGEVKATVVFEMPRPAEKKENA